MTIDPQWVSAMADAVVAGTAVVAAVYGLRQYTHSVRSQEIDRAYELHRSVQEIYRDAQSEPNALHLRGLLDLMELNERLIAEGALSKRTAQFYRDIAGFDEDLSTLPAEVIQIIKSLIRNNPKSYKHLTATLKRTRPGWLAEG
ncbi:hypothetical protein GOL30_23305 [Sinorhizobium medicae]|nr:hypothetical protein [Sinorhizobium medicae]MDX1077636.1 hypothetical protein [Sinorhizobium medicae]